VQKGFKTHHQEETKRVQELRDGFAIALKSVDNVEATRSQDNSEGNPETTIGRERSSTEGVANSHLPVYQTLSVSDFYFFDCLFLQLGKALMIYLPHTSEKLDETSIAVGEGNDNVRMVNILSIEIDERQDEGGESEGGKTKRSRVGEGLLGLAIETRLEFTTKGS